MTRRITLADVARRAGLSASTVSFVLNDRPGSRIPQETAERVRAAARELGYTPDHQARGLKTGRSATLGFISDEVTVTRYASGMIPGILDTAEARHHGVLMTETGHRESRVRDAVADLRSRRIDGLVVGLMQAREIGNDLASRVDGLPTVMLNGVSSGLPAVLPDEYTAGRRTVEYLLQRGHRSVAVVGRSDEHADPRMSVTVKERFRGMDDAMREAGLEFEVEVPGADWEPEKGYLAAPTVLDVPSVTAVVAGNDRVAIGLYQGFQEAGTSIPEDMSVISFDDEPLASYMRPGLTTTQLPYARMGQVATDLLLDRVTAGEDVPERTLVPMPLVERASVKDIRG